jgi:hypothetical protein
MDNKSLEMVEQFIYLRTTLTNQNSGHEKCHCILNKECLLSFGAGPFPSSFRSKNIKIKLHTPVYVCCYLWAQSLVCHVERGVSAEGV